MKSTTESVRLVHPQRQHTSPNNGTSTPDTAEPNATPGSRHGRLLCVSRPLQQLPRSTNAPKSRTALLLVLLQVPLWSAPLRIAAAQRRTFRLQRLPLTSDPLQRTQRQGRHPIASSASGPGTLRAPDRNGCGATSARALLRLVDASVSISRGCAACGTQRKRTHPVPICV